MLRKATSVFVLPLIGLAMQAGVATLNSATGPPATHVLPALLAYAAPPAMPLLTTTTTTTPRTSATPAATHTELPRASRVAPAPRRPAPTADLSSLLDRLADCESGRNPRAVGGGGRFFGAFQYLLSTWHSLGMAGNPVDFDYATQKASAARIPVSSWHRQFPVCSRRIGA